MSQKLFVASQARICLTLRAIVAVWRDLAYLQDDVSQVAEIDNRNSDPANWQAVVMLPIAAQRADNDRPTPEPLTSDAAVLTPIPVSLQLIVSISKERIQLPSDVRPASERQMVHKSLINIVHGRYEGPGHVPELHPIDDMGITHPKVKLAYEEAQKLKQMLTDNVIHQKEQGSTVDQKQYEELKDMATERVDLQTKLARSQLTDFKNEVKMRLRVLKRLGHFDKQGMLTTKGKAAAEVSMCCRFRG